MKALLDGETIAEASVDDLIRIEGNWYFPPQSVREQSFAESPTPYTCPWKGECQYFDVTVGGQSHHDAAWSYPHPLPSAFERVGKDFSGYVAFSEPVQVVE